MSRASRALKRALVEKALESKVVGKIEEAPPPVAKAPDAPKVKRLRLPINEEQLNLLTNAQAAIQAAQANLDALLRAMVAQHHIVNGQVRELIPGRPPKLLIEVPADDPPTRKKGRS